MLLKTTSKLFQVPHIMGIFTISHQQYKTIKCKNLSQRMIFSQLFVNVMRFN